MQISGVHSPSGDYDLLPILISALAYEKLNIVSPSKKVLTATYSILEKIHTSSKASQILDNLNKVEWLFNYFDTLKELRSLGIARLDPDYEILVDSFPSKKHYCSKLKFYKSILHLKDLIGRDPSSIFHNNDRKDFRFLDLDVLPNDLKDIILSQAQTPTKHGRLILSANKSSIRFRYWVNWITRQYDDDSRLPEKIAYWVISPFCNPVFWLSILLLPYGLFNLYTYKSTKRRFENFIKRSETFYDSINKYESLLFLSDRPVSFLSRLREQCDVIEAQKDIRLKYGLHVPEAKLIWTKKTIDSLNLKEAAEDSKVTMFESLTKSIIELSLPKLNLRDPHDLLKAKFIAKDEVLEFRSYLSEILESSKEIDPVRLEALSKRIITASRSIHFKLLDARGRLPNAVFQGAAGGMSLGFGFNALFSNVYFPLSLGSTAVLGVSLAIREFSKKKESIIKNIEGTAPPMFLVKLPWK